MHPLQAAHELKPPLQH